MVFGEIQYLLNCFTKLLNKIEIGFLLNEPKYGEEKKEWKNWNGKKRKQWKDKEEKK